jgi:hypothetical protein
VAGVSVAQILQGGHLPKCGTLNLKMIAQRIRLRGFSRKTKLLLLATTMMLALALCVAILLHAWEVRQKQDGRWTYQYVIRRGDNGQELIIGQSIRLHLVVGWQWTYHADGPLRHVAHNTFAGDPQDGIETITARHWFCASHCRVTFTVQVFPDDLMGLCASGSMQCVPPIPPAGLVEIL